MIKRRSISPPDETDWAPTTRNRLIETIYSMFCCSDDRRSARVPNILEILKIFSKSQFRTGRADSKVVRALSYAFVNEQSNGVSTDLSDFQIYPKFIYD